MPQSRNSRSRTFMGWTPVLATMKLPLGMVFSSSGVIKGRSIIWRLWDGSFFPLLMEPLITVRLPSALETSTAVWLEGAKPPKIFTWQLSTMISEPSLELGREGHIEF